MATAEAQNLSLAATAERRINRLTLALGFVAAVVVTVWISLRAGFGVLAGAVLAWINARWLQQALDALVLLSKAQAGGSKPRISIWVYVKLFARYALMAAVGYVMVKYLAVPVMSLLAGLLALGAATMAEFFYEILNRSK
jgi:hypothetical protein